MHARLIFAGISLLAITVATSAAQDRTYGSRSERDPFRRTYSFDADYEFCVRLPHQKAAVELTLGEQALANIGAVGTLGLLTLGGTDFASLSDAGDFFDHVDGGPEAILDLIRGRAAIEGGTVPALPRLLAVRAVAARGFKPALGVLHAVNKTGVTDPFLAQAVRESIASLSGEALAPTIPVLPTLAVTLARIPDSVQAIVVVDHHRFPSASTLFSIGADAGDAVFRQVIENVGPEEREILDTAIRYSTSGRALGYLIAKRFGNFRVHRSVMAVKFRETLAEQPYFQWYAEGEFDLDAMAAGFAWAELEVERKDEAVVIRSSDGHQARIERNRVVLWHDEFQPTEGAKHVAFRTCLDRLESGAALAVWIDESTPYPEEIGVFRPRQAALW
ncbi:MAG: hypothetical protein AB7I19_16070, partial [Planctomycetota bacterium]